MAEYALKISAQKLSHHILVEIQGSVGARDVLSADELGAVDLVVLATDIEVDTSRFVGKRVHRCSAGDALN